MNEAFYDGLCALGLEAMSFSRQVLIVHVLASCESRPLCKKVDSLSGIWQNTHKTIDPQHAKRDRFAAPFLGGGLVDFLLLLFWPCASQCFGGRNQLVALPS